MKKYFLAIIMVATYMYAQTEQQAIELPDFVITGKQNVDLPSVAKRKPDYISTISKDFLMPQYLPEEIPLLFSSDPAPVIPAIKNIQNIFNGTLELQAGRYSFPQGRLSINQSLENYLFNALLWGSNIREYISNSGYNDSGISLNNEFFFSTKSDFLPGAKINLSAGYFRNSYNLYAFKDPNYLRETSNGSIKGSIENSYNRWINFNVNFTWNIFSLSESGLKETNLDANGLLEFKFGSFTIGGTGIFKKQSVSNNLSGSSGNNYYSTNGYIKIFPVNFLNFIFGLNYASDSKNNFLTPYGNMDLKIDKGLTISVGFNPHTEFYNFTDLFKRNLFFNPGIIDNVFSKYKFNLRGKVEYEYEKLFSLSFKGSYSKIEDYYYFEDLKDKGKFDLYILPESKIYTFGMNFIINPAYYGYFIGDVELKSAKDNLNNFIPYEPGLNSSLTYGYNFKNGIGFEIKYNMLLNIYTDITNSNKLNDYHNISLSFYYELFKSLKLTADFQNVLNRSNFVWLQYQEKPFDLLLGIEYRW